MKKKLLYALMVVIAIVTIFWFQSCKKDSFKDPVKDSYSYQNDTLFVSIDMATEVAENVNKSEIVLQTVDKNRLKSTPYKGKRVIRSKQTVMDKENATPYFYVINFNPEGYVVIPADKRLRPILAYGDKGFFKSDSLPGGIKTWFEMMAVQEQNLRTTKALPSKYMSAQWASMSCDESLLKSTQIVYCPPPTPTGNTEVNVTVGPLLNTTWDQSYGYNTYCPALSSGPNGHAWAGCVTIAMAQVMHYWKYPATYNGNTINWNSMSLTSGNDQVAKLVGYIFPLVIDSYGSDGSGCSNDFKISRSLRGSFNYTTATLAGWVNLINYNGGYNYWTVVSEINKRQPVILGGFTVKSRILGIPIAGDGHSWVCDGYSQTTYYTDGVETYQTLYFDMNWGWGGSSNGWYAFDYWPTFFGTISCYIDIIYDIHP